MSITNREILNNVLHLELEHLLKDLDIEKLTDYLVEYGVIVCPYKINDTIYYATGIHNKLVKPAKVREIYYNGDCFSYYVESDNGVLFVIQEDEILKH